MKKSILLSLLVLSFTLFNCEGMKSISAVVVSSKDKKPISNAEINVLNKVGDSTVTNLKRSFKLQSGFINMTFGGPRFKFEIKKKGYETLIVKTGKDLDTIKLKKLKNN